jgi:predicted NBD/HSP70 family sugar kinase
METTDKYTIRKQNELVILEEIIKSGPLSRAELAKICGLNKATVSEIVKTLIDRKLVTETGIGTSTQAGGRRPIILQFIAKAGISISIDIGYNYIAFMLTYLDGSIIQEHYQENIKIDRHNVCKSILDVYRLCKEQAPPTEYGIIGIAIAIHGVTLNNEIIFTPYYDLNKLNLVEIIEKETGIPVLIENEANLSAIAELAYHSHFSNLVSISIHSGIGAGIILDKELHYGKNGYAGEIGHTILFPGGKACPCGNRGCLEQYYSEKAILERFSLLNRERQQSSFHEIAQAVEQNNEETIKLLKETAKYISIAINNVNNTYNPDVIFLNSELIRTIPSLLETIKEELTCFMIDDIEVASSSLGNRAILIGATYLNIQHFLGIKSLYFSKEQIYNN